MLPHLNIHSSLTIMAVENSDLCGRTGSKLCGLDNGRLAHRNSLWCRDCVTCCISQDCWGLACFCSRLLLGHLVISRIKVFLLSSDKNHYIYENRKINEESYLLEYNTMWSTESQQMVHAASCWLTANSLHGMIPHRRQNSS